MREIPSSLSAATSSMMSRDPDGVNLPEDYSSQLEPSGSHYSERVPTTIDSRDPDASADIVVEALDIKKIIGVPPPPPTSKPPSKRKKKSNSSMNKVKMSDSKLMSSLVEEKNEDSTIHNYDINQKNTPSPSPSRNQKVVSEGAQFEKSLNDNLQGNEEPVGELSFSVTQPSAATIQRDTRESPDSRNQEEISTEVLAHSNENKSNHETTSEEIGKVLSSNPKSKSKDQKRTKKRTFFKKLFGMKKNNDDSLSSENSDITSSKDFAPASKNLVPESKAVLNNAELRSQAHSSDEVVSVSSKSTNKDITDKVSNTLQISKEFYFDPPDNDSEDPPEYSGRPLLSPTAFREQESDTIEDEQMRIGSARSQNVDVHFDNKQHPVVDLKECKSQSLSNDSDDTFSEKSSLQVQTTKIISRDPAGSSPLLQASKGGNSMDQWASGDPTGDTPKARDNTNVSSNDPVGESFCHASKTTKPPMGDEIQILFDVSNSNEVTNAEPEHFKNVSTGFFEAYDQCQESSAKDVRESVEIGIPGRDRSVLQSSNIKVDNSSKFCSNEDKVLKTTDQDDKSYDTKIQLDIEKSGFNTTLNTTAKDNKPLTVSAAAFTNANAIAYIHRLQGETSPRLTWHSDSSIAPPLSEKSTALAKIRAFSSKRKKGKARNQIRPKGPSPDEYSATNSKIEAMIKEKQYVNHDPTKHFTAYSRFKGRRPRQKAEKESPTPEIPLTPSQDAIQPSINLKLIIPSGKISGLAIARGIELRQIQRETGSVSAGGRGLGTRQKIQPTGGNRFNFFPANDSEIKDPVQRAGRRLLSKAAIPIQAGIRMFLSRREAMDRMWALIRVQSYIRRWKCEQYLRARKRSAQLVQKVYRGHKGRKEQQNRNASAISIQRIVRGYLTALRAYETIYYVTRAQALARGFIVRTLNARRDEILMVENKAANLIQDSYRDYVSRKKALLMKQISDVIIVQSVVRRRAAIRRADLLRKSIHSIAITRFQAMWRGCSERNRRKRSIAENKAATKIQASWRGFQAYTDFIFIIVDILVVQRNARQWLAVRKMKKLRQERAAIVLQSAWRRRQAEVNLLYSLVHIIVVQSIARRFLAKNEFAKRQQLRERINSVQRRKESAATTIQKYWRGFWGFSHFIIVKYEVTRIQALMRGTIARNRFNLEVGCSILIQAAARRFLARKQASIKAVGRTIDTTFAAARALELRERNSAKHIQFWWRIVLDWMKEKKAALVIERFFMYVKSEVDRELREMEQKRIMSKKSQKKGKKVSRDSFPNKDWMNAEHPFGPPQIQKKNARSQSAPRSRPPRKNVQVSDKHIQPLKNRSDHGGYFEPSDMQPLPSVLDLNPSDDFSIISNITNPSVLNQFSKGIQNSRVGHDQVHSEEIYKEVRARPKNEKQRRLSTEDYIKKYGGLKTAPNKSLSKSQSNHFFSDDKDSRGSSKQKRQSYDGASTIYMQRSSKSTTPRKGRSQYGKPKSLSTEVNEDFDLFSNIPSTPRSSFGVNRGGSTPTRARRDASASKFLPPVTPTRKKSAAILRAATGVTESSKVEKTLSRPSPRKYSNRVMIMKTNPDFMDDKTIEEAHEIMLLGDEYGEV